MFDESRIDEFKSTYLTQKNDDYSLILKNTELLYII